MLPTYTDIEDPLILEIARQGGRVEPGDVVGPLGRHFQLTQDDYAIRTSDGEARNKWENMVRYARRRLVDQGLIDGTVRGIWKLTDAGLERAAALGHQD